MKKVLIFIITLFFLQTLMFCKKSDNGINDLSADTSKVELVVQKGQEGGSFGYSKISGNGKYVVTSGPLSTKAIGSSDFTMKKWDVKTGLLYSTYAGFTSEIEKIDISDNGLYICGLDNNNLLVFGNSVKPIYSNKFNESDIIELIGFEKDESTILFQHNNEIILFDFIKNNPVRTFDDIPNQINKTGLFKLNHEQNKLYFDTYDNDRNQNSLLIWDFSSGKLENSINLSSGKINECTAWDIIKDDGIIASDEKGIIKVFKIIGDKIEMEYDVKLQKKEMIMNITVSNDSKYAGIVQMEDTTGYIYDIEKKRLVNKFYTFSHFPFYPPDPSLSFSKDNKYILSDLFLVDFSTSKIIQEYSGKSGFIWIDNIVSKDENNFLIFSQENNTFLLNINKFQDLFKEYDKLRFTPDLNKAYRIEDNKCIVFLTEVENNKFDKLQEIIIPQDYEIVYSNSNKYLTLIKSLTYESTETMLVNFETGEIIKKEINYTSYPLVSLSSDNNLIAFSNTDKCISIYELPSFNLKTIYTGHQNTEKFPGDSWLADIKFTSDNKFVISNLIKPMSGSIAGDYRIWKIEDNFDRYPINSSPEVFDAVHMDEEESKLIISEKYGNLYISDIETGKKEKEYKSLNSTISYIGLTKDRKYIIASTFDDVLNLIDYNTGEIVLKIVQNNKNDILAFSNDNYYLSTKGGRELVAFRKGNNVYPPEQFDLQYNRPDIVLERLGYAAPEVIESYRKAYEKRLKKMNFKEEMFNKDFHLPEIKIMNDNIATVVNNKEIQLDIKVWDTKYNLNRVNVYNNDVPIYGLNGINLSDKSTSDYKESIKINLLNGKNKLQVSVLNDKGVESLKETVEITCEAEKIKPNLYILAIGTSDYNDTKYKLTYAAKDANDLTELFKDKQGEYGEVKVMKLLDKEVTKENILKAKEFLMQTRVDDEVIVFVAGHGLLNKNYDYYYATCDIDFRNPEVRGITFDEIESLLDGIPALKKILFMDTCHSGEVDKEDIVAVEKQKEEKGEVTFRDAGDVEYREKEGTRLGLKNTNQLLQELFVDLRRGSGTMVISSAGGMEFAWEGGEFKNGLFTYSLLDGLKNKKADLNSDGTITVSELRDYVSKTVEDLTGGKQKPTMRRENIEFDFKVW